MGQAIQCQSEANVGFEESFVSELQRKWALAQKKVALMQVTHDLLQDDYTREEPVLFSIIQMLENEERFCGTACGNK